MERVYESHSVSPVPKREWPGGPGPAIFMEGKVLIEKFPISCREKLL